MLDKYFIGSVSRISPEAPVPIVKVNKEMKTLGGSANVANNISSLKMSSTLLGIVGDDIYHQELADLCSHANIIFLPVISNFPTITKIRVIGEHQQITRLDFEDKIIINPQDLENIKKIINKLDHLEAIIISDYNKGSVSDEMCAFLLKFAKKENIPVFIDPKGNNWLKYNGAYMLTPNVKEICEILGRNIPNNDMDIEQAGKEVFAKYDFQNLLITRSEKGMTLLNKNNGHLKAYHIPTKAREVYDVSGAGDTVIAVVAWATVEGKSIEEAIHLANIAAGIVVSKLGTVPIELEELLCEIHQINSKIITADTLKTTIKNIKAKGKRIVFTNGCFDILHRGHTDYLRKAKELGDLLIIGVNSDESVRRLKGDGRPVNNTEDRTDLLSHLEFVDYVVVFNEDTPYELIKIIAPDILAKGGDYKAENVVGREFAKDVIIIPFVKGYSSTETLRKLSLNDSSIQ